jgi:AraC-like DNA-binding protein
MSRQKNKIAEVNTISQLHRLFGLPKPLHPLISVYRFDDVSFTISDIWSHFTTNLYSIAIKKGETGKIKYGQTLVDFDEGVLTLTAPGQVIAIENLDDITLTGYKLTFHPDFIQSYPLAKKIKEYGFFSYSLHKALFLSEQEEETLANLFQSVEKEYKTNIDKFSQDVMIAIIELLLVHIERFYSRQFITRKNISGSTLAQAEELMTDYFQSDKATTGGLPTVKYLAEKVNLSPDYLSDLLRNLTGLTAQQYIHQKLIDRAKDLLTTTNLTVGEIAYQLGFEYPQSFNKLFKKKMQVSPLEFRQSFN